MNVRRLSELERTQTQMLEDMRSDRAAAFDAAVESSESTRSMALAIGRVDAVVTSDPELGAHLSVAKQRASGVPPTFADDAVAVRAYYPAPGRVVGDYSVDEFVLCCSMDGVRIALKVV